MLASESVVISRAVAAILLQGCGICRSPLPPISPCHAVVRSWPAKPPHVRWPTAICRLPLSHLTDTADSSTGYVPCIGISAVSFVSAWPGGPRVPPPRRLLFHPQTSEAKSMPRLDLPRVHVQSQSRRVTRYGVTIRPSAAARWLRDCLSPGNQLQGAVTTSSARGWPCVQQRRAVQRMRGLLLLKRRATRWRRARASPRRLEVCWFFFLVRAEADTCPIGCRRRAEPGTAKPPNAGAQDAARGRMPGAWPE